MFTDERRCNVWDRIRQQDLRVFGKILTPALMKEAAQAAGVKLRSSPLNCANLVWLGIAAALHSAKNFADILVLTFKLLEDADLWKPDGPPPKRKRRASKHNPHGKQGVLVSEEAFVQARQRMPMDFWLWLILLLAQRFQTQHPEAVQWKGFRLLALDGTEIALPHWKTLGGSFRHQPQRPAAAAAAGADGDVGLSSMPAAVALRTDAAIVPRTDDRGASVGTCRAARLGVDGSRLLELRAVLANPAPSSVFRHPPAARRETENAGTTGAGRPAGDVENAQKVAEKVRRGKTCPTCRNR